MSSLREHLVSVATAWLDENGDGFTIEANGGPSRPFYSGSFDLDGLVRAIGVAATLDAAATVEQLRIVHEREFGKPLQYVATPPEIADRLRREAHELEVAE